MSPMQVRCGGRVHDIAASLRDGRLIVPGERPEVLAVAPLGGGAWQLEGPGDAVRVAHVVRRQDTWWIHLDGRTVVLEAVARRRQEAPGSLAAPMTGRVLEVRVREGDRVEAGQPVVVLSAMKMQVELKAPVAGIVRRIVHGAGEQVEGGTQVLVVEAEDAPGTAP